MEWVVQTTPPGQEYSITGAPRIANGNVIIGNSGAEYGIRGYVTAWDTFAFDPEANLVYVGTGNGAPWSDDVRSPGGGDNLYLSSILALNTDDGELVSSSTA